MTEVEIHKMRDELSALVLAWVDRGVSYESAVEVVTGCGVRSLLAMGASYADFDAANRQIWRTFGGRP